MQNSREKDEEPIFQVPFDIEGNMVMDPERETWHTWRNPYTFEATLTAEYNTQGYGLVEKTPPADAEGEVHRTPHIECHTITGRRYVRLYDEKGRRYAMLLEDFEDPAVRQCLGHPARWGFTYTPTKRYESRYGALFTVCLP